MRLRRSGVERHQYPARRNDYRYRSRLYDVRVDGALIIEKLKSGVQMSVAAKACGVPVDIARKWLFYGRRGVGFRDEAGPANEDHVWFAEEVDRVLGDVEVNAALAWRTAAETNWQAARDFLARRFPERWGNTEQRQIEVRGAQQMELQLVWGDEASDGESDNGGRELDDQDTIASLASGTAGSGGVSEAVQGVSLVGLLDEDLDE